MYKRKDFFLFFLVFMYNIIGSSKVFFIKISYNYYYFFLYFVVVTNMENYWKMRVEVCIENYMGNVQEPLWDSCCKAANP